MIAALVLTAAGRSERMGGPAKKEYFTLQKNGNGRESVLSSALFAFLETGLFSIIVITVPQDGEAEARAVLLNDIRVAPFLKQNTCDDQKYPDIRHQSAPPSPPILLFAPGGASRQESVRNGLEKIQGVCEASIQTQRRVQVPEIVLVHDGARPWVSHDVILSVFESVKRHGAAVPAIAAVDTQKETDSQGKIVRHLDRSHVVSVQTPQGFLFTSLLEAHRKAATDGSVYTDDTEIWGRYVSDVYACPGDHANKKITYPEDIKPERKMIRVGLGYDLHRLVAEKQMRLGGICIPSDRGEEGHSDGDVLLHAIMDALLGASGLGDIGEFFPPSESRWRNADSGKLLSIAWKQIQEQGWELENLDCVIALQEPKILPWRTQIRSSIAVLLSVPEECVFIKGKTGEGLGPIGSCEAVEAWATCLLSRV